MAQRQAEGDAWTVWSNCGKSPPTVQRATGSRRKGDYAAHRVPLDFSTQRGVAQRSDRRHPDHPVRSTKYMLLYGVCWSKSNLDEAKK